MSRRRREALLVVAAAAALTVALTWPLANEIGRVGRVDTADGRFSIWNVAWVARTLPTDPLHVFDANIFYPHTGTLAYSEANLGAGILAMPAYWLTRNPFAAHNSAVLLAFILTAVSTYYLAKHLTADAGAAALSAVCFAFTPFVFAHMAHIQLLMTAGLPLSMLMFHRLADDASPSRGGTLGLALAATAISCGYYGVFAALMVGYATIVVATTRGLWLNARYWISISTAAALSIALVSPVFIPYARLQQDQGFQRALVDANAYSATWSAYLASAAHLHVWMLKYVPPWTEVVFPGFIVLILGVSGFVVVLKQRREIAAIYGGIAAVAFWASFGPAAGLYAVLYRGVPLFGWLRAPARFGLLVALALSLFAAFAVTRLKRRFALPQLVAACIAMVAAFELRVGSNIPEAEPFDPVYRTLATLPRGPVIELPFYYLRNMFPLHTQYMLNSTQHWFPLVNGYSDYFPQDFVDNVMTMAPFPTVPSMKLIEPGKVRYAVFHLYGYNDSNRRDILARLKELENNFRPLYTSETTRLYEIVGYPP